MGKLSGCGPALVLSCTGMPYARILQHMVTLAGTEAHWKPPGASHKCQVPRACQLLHFGEEHPMERMCRSSQVQLMEREGQRAHDL